MDYLLIYFLIKLNDFKIALDNQYGFTVLMCLFIFIFLFIATGKSKNEDGTYKNYEPFSGLFEDHNKKKVKRSFILLILAFSIQLSCNMAVTLLPSTGQIAVIYLGAKGLQSDTLKEVTNIDPKFASYLKRESDKWLSDQVVVAKELVEETIK